MHMQLLYAFKLQIDEPYSGLLACLINSYLFSTFSFFSYLHFAMTT